MMNKWLKSILCIGFCLMFCCLSVGYATLNDELYVTGTMSYTVTNSELNPDDGSAPEEDEETTIGNYTYKYSKKDGINGWMVVTTSTGEGLADPGPFMETINGEPVTSINETFKNNKNITVAPIMHGNIQNMRDAFWGCTNLKTYAGSTDPDGDFSDYPIPSRVVNMSDTFRECTSLVYAPVIPSSVTDISSLFHDCTSLTGTVTINATLDGNNLSSGDVADNCFNGVNFETQKIRLDGSCAYLDQVATEASGSSDGLWKNGYCERCNGWCSEHSDTFDLDNVSGITFENSLKIKDKRQYICLKATYDSDDLPETLYVTIDQTTYAVPTESGESESSYIFWTDKSIYILYDFLSSSKDVHIAVTAEQPTEVETSDAYFIDATNVQNLSVESIEVAAFDLESKPNLLLTLTPYEGYLLPETFTVTIGETVYTISTNGENELETMFFDTESRTLYISGDVLPEDGSAVVITAYAVPETPPYKVEASLENIHMDWYTTDNGLYISITAIEGYLLPETFTVTIGETTYTIYTTAEEDATEGQPSVADNPAGMGFDTVDNILVISDALIPEDATISIAAVAVPETEEEETEPEETEPEETEPEETEPEETEPEETEPEETEPEETEPEETEPEETEPEETDPEETEPEETEPEETEPEETEPEETEPKETEPVETEPEEMKPKETDHEVTESETEPLSEVTS